jgi:argininosuccinate lyase
VSDAGVAHHLQWGGRFAQPPDPRLLAFGASLEDDLPLAPFDVRCSHAHVTAQLRGGLITKEQAGALYGALDRVAEEIAGGIFADYARRGGYEDIHGAIDARVRELVPAATGDALHAGRSRNDQVATTLALYSRERAQRAGRICIAIARRSISRHRRWSKERSSPERRIGSRRSRFCSHFGCTPQASRSCAGRGVLRA